MLADVEVDDRLRGWTSLTRPKSPRKRAVGTAKKSMPGRGWRGRSARSGTAGCAACLGRNSWRRGAGFLRTGWGSVRLRRPEPVTDRRPADESTSGPEGEDDQDEEDAQARGGDREEIEGDQVRTWLARKLRQVWDGGVCRMLGLECLAARSRLFQNGRGLGPAKASGARHRPTPRRREHGRAQRGEDDHQGTGKPGTGPD